MYDIIIIGAGVIGCSVARELSKYNLNICVLEKASDVAEGTTKANSAIIHGGHDAKSGTLKAKLNVQGNAMFDKLSEELDFPFKRNGALVLCFNEKDKLKLENLFAQGKNNGVPNLRIINKEELKALEPNISDEALAALYVPSSGIVCPYEMTLALAENAFLNGVEFKFETKVVDIIKETSKFLVKCNNGNIEGKLIVNAAGLFSDDINNMVSENKFNIIPRKGEYCLFDKAVGRIVKSTLFQLPTIMGKGILVTPTVDGNLLMGPTAVDIKDKEDFSTTADSINEVLNKAKMSIKEVPSRYIITSFSGIRAHTSFDDFIIGEASDATNFINTVGIESPGLSSAPAIAKMVCDIITYKISPTKKDNFNPIRKGIPKFRELNNNARRELILKDPSYGKIVCRCETVTEGEIINSIRRPLGARTIDGVKRRTRAGMGRCQSGFCITKTVDILSRELKLSPDKITKCSGNSNLLVGKNKNI